MNLGVFFKMPAQKKSGYKVGEAIDAAMNGESKPLAYIPPGRRTGTSIAPTKVTTVKQQLVRIEHEGDPLGFLINALHGAVFDVQIVLDTGKVLTVKEQVSLKDRVKIAMFLANKQLPNLTLTRVVGDPPPGSGNDGAGGAGMSFAQMVAKAAHNEDVPIRKKPPVIIDVVQEDTVDDSQDE